MLQDIRKCQVFLILHYKLNPNVTRRIIDKKIKYIIITTLLLSYNFKVLFLAPKNKPL